MTSLAERPPNIVPQTSSAVPPSIDGRPTALSTPPPAVAQSPWPDEDYRGWASL